MAVQVKSAGNISHSLTHSIDWHEKWTLHETSLHSTVLVSLIIIIVIIIKQRGVKMKSVLSSPRVQLPSRPSDCLSTIVTYLTRQVHEVHDAENEASPPSPPPPASLNAAYHLNNPQHIANNGLNDDRQYTVDCIKCMRDAEAYQVYEVECLCHCETSNIPDVVSCTLKCLSNEMQERRKVFLRSIGHSLRNISLEFSRLSSHTHSTSVLRARTTLY